VVVIGAGDATGGAIAERFAKEGYAACLVRRNGEKLAPLVARIEESGGKAFAFGVDARIEGGIRFRDLLQTICQEQVFGSRLFHYIQSFWMMVGGQRLIKPV
jgi:NAD(P)-dependent dehydrogenase (short-subunit alcohol dehydrogenase family)